MSSQHSYLLAVTAVVLANQMVGCGATFNIFISSSQLESYFQGMEELLELVRGFQVDIVRNGVSLVLEDGSLQLVEEEEEEGSGSGEAPTAPTARVRRLSSSFLTPLSSLPALPADVDEVVLNWDASANVSYQLSLSETPIGHFEVLSFNISESGFIPQEEGSAFSVLFPCAADADGIGSLQVTLQLVTSVTTNITFSFDKCCQIEATPSSSLPASTPVLLSTLSPTSTVPLDSATPTMPLVSVAPTMAVESATPTMALESATPTMLLESVTPTIVDSSMIPTPTPSVGIPITTVPTTKPDTSGDQFVQLLIIVFGPVVGVLAISIIILCCSLCICLCCCKRKSRKHFNDDPAELPMNMMIPDLYAEAFELEDKKDEAPLSLWMSLPWGAVSNLPAGIQGIIKRHSVDRRSLSILATVSRGDYGCIVNGQLSVNKDLIGGNKGIMMKMCIGFQKQYGHRDEVTKFLEQATLLRGLDHPNVHSLSRVSVEDNFIPLVVYPIIEYGNLHQFLILCRMTPNDSPLGPVTLQYKVSFAYQIASGMKHLVDNSIIHPDLALRNCYLDTNYQVKISDGALSQCFYPECYHAVKGAVRPVRWAAIETLQEGLCSSQSNVWSYGVTLWEVMTLAKLPYGDQIDHNRGVLTHLLMQNRLLQPEDCPDNIYSVMTDCWKFRAEDRPNLTTIHTLVADIHHKYAAIQSTAPPTSHGAEEISYSTFGKDLRSHDAPPLETAQVSHHRMKSGGSFRSSISRGSPMNSQRNSQMFPVEGSGVGDRLSITFSVLSNENELGNSSESEGEEQKGLDFEIPSFLIAGAEENGSSAVHPGPAPVYTGQIRPQTRSQRAESPMDLVSTFMVGSKSPRNDQTDAPSPSTLVVSPSSMDSRRPSPLTPVPPPATPPSIGPLSCDATSFASSQTGTEGPDVMSPPTFSGTTSPATCITPSNQDTVSKPSTPDSFTTTYSSGQPSTPASHIPGIPSSTYNNTSVSIDDVRLRNGGALLSAESSSHAHSGTSKSDSGIRSDEEAESVLSNGGPSEPVAGRGGVAKRLSTVNNRDSVHNRDSATSLGLGGLSSDLMATFASWGKD